MEELHPRKCEYETATVRVAGDGWTFEPAKFTNIESMPTEILLAYQKAGISECIDILNGLESLAFSIKQRSKALGDQISRARAGLDVLTRFANELEAKTKTNENDPETLT